MPSPEGKVARHSIQKLLYLNIALPFPRGRGDAYIAPQCRVRIRIGFRRKGNGCRRADVGIGPYGCS